jgi:hypothetical protein
VTAAGSIDAGAAVNMPAADISGKMEARRASAAAASI